jgi:hypothetical protein
MKKILLLLIPLMSYSQENFIINKIIIDSETKKPLENVSVYNNQDFTISNYEGKFRFVTDKDSLNLKLLGYKTLCMSVKNIQKIDTLFLLPQTTILEEVVVKGNSTETYLNNIFEKIKNSTPKSEYTESFFLRTVLKRNLEIFQFQDLAGKVKRPELYTSKKNYEKDLKINLLNMRRIGLKTNSKDIEDFEYFSFSDFFYRLILLRIDFKKHHFKNFNLSNSNYKKIIFNPIDNLDSKASNGYYLTENNSLKKVVITSNPNYNKIPFVELRNFKYRTISTDLRVTFNYNSTHKKHYISDATFEGKLEVINPEEETIIYDVKYNLLITDGFLNNKIKSNFSSKKDVFKANEPYNESFWLNQNQLLLDKKLKLFIEQTKDLNTTEFEIIKNY